MEAERVNALMIPVVLQTLFQQPSLDFGDLKNARLTCKEWYFQSLPRWRKTAVITVSAVDDCWVPFNLPCATEGECTTQEEGQNYVDGEEWLWDADVEGAQKGEDDEGQMDMDDVVDEEKCQKDVVKEEGHNDVYEEEYEDVDYEEEQWDVYDVDNNTWEQDVDDKAKVNGIAEKSYLTVAEYLQFLDADNNLVNSCDSDDNPLPLENKLAAYPYPRLRMLDWNDMTQVRDDFWTRIGNHLEYLHLENCQVVDDKVDDDDDDDDDEEVEWYWKENLGVINMTANQLPKLTTLMISNSTATDNTRYSLNATVWMEENERGVQMVPHDNLKVFHTSGCKVKWSLVFTCFPKLQDIRDSDDEYHAGSQEWDVLRELVTQPQEIQKSLKSLDLIHSRECRITPPVLYLFGNLGLHNLTYLSIVLDRSIRECAAQNAFKSLFHKNGNLKVWKVLREGSAAPPFREFPDGIEMTSLKELHLYGNVTRSMQFIRFTPNLERLVMYFTCDGNGKQSVDGRQFGSGERSSGSLVGKAIRRCVEGSFKPLEKMESLWVDVELSVKSLGVLEKWMPKLKGLRTVLNNLSFKKVCSQWGTGLEELVCLKESKVDEGTLVGFNPNITDLIDLRRFGLEERKTVTISDEVVVDGFLKMGRLEAVQLPVEVQSQLSSEAIERLKQKIARLEII